MGDLHSGAEEQAVRYVAVLVEGQRLPHAVVRLNGQAEEVLASDLTWEPSDLLARVPSEPAWKAQDTSAVDVVGLIKTMRAEAYESELADYKYYASFKDALGVLDLTTVDRLIRRPEGAVEEEYSGHETWEPSETLHLIDSGLDQEYVALSLTEAAQAKRLIDAQWDRGCSHHVVLVDDRPVAAVTSVLNDPEAELAFTGDPEPQPSRLLSQAAREPRMKAVRTPMATAVETMARLTLRRRTADQPAGHAVFHRLTDVLDLDSAYDVVAEPEQHKFTLPLDSAEHARLTARLHVRNARRAAKPVDGHYYFAVFERLEDVTDPATALSLLRVPEDSGQWQAATGDGEWQTTDKPQKLITVPLDQAYLPTRST